MTDAASAPPSATPPVRLHWREDGDPAGRPILFLNSLGTDLRLWDAVLPHLPRGYQILRCDTRGHGLSDAPPGPYRLADLVGDVAAELDARDVRDLVVVGVSLGGMMAQALARQRPERVRAIVLSNTAARLGSEELWASRAEDVRARGMAGVAQSILERWFAPEFLSTPQVGVWRAMLVAAPAHGYAGCCAALGAADLTDETATLTVPTLVVGGGADKASPPDVVRSVAALIPGAAYVELPGVGHLPAAEAPEAFAAVLRRFLAGLPTADRRRRGDGVRRSVLGDAHVDAAAAKTTAFDAAFQDLIQEGAWGSVWASEGLSRRERSLLTLALLAACGNFDEIPMHVRATARTGASPADVAEALQHVAIYAGVPRANHALKLAKATFREMAAAEDAAVEKPEGGGQT